MEDPEAVWLLKHQSSQVLEPFNGFNGTLKLEIESLFIHYFWPSELLITGKIILNLFFSLLPERKPPLILSVI